LASLLHRHHTTEVNQTLHNIWPSPGLVHYIYILGAVAPSRNSTRCKNSLCILILRLYRQRYCTVLEQWASAKLCGVQQMAPPICDRAAITLDIGPHSSFFCYFPKFLHTVGCSLYLRQSIKTITYEKNFFNNLSSIVIFIAPLKFD